MKRCLGATAMFAALGLGACGDPSRSACSRACGSAGERPAGGAPWVPTWASYMQLPTGSVTTRDALMKVSFDEPATLVL